MKNKKLVFIVSLTVALLSSCKGVFSQYWLNDKVDGASDPPLKLDNTPCRDQSECASKSGCRIIRTMGPMDGNEGNRSIGYDDTPTTCCVPLTMKQCGDAGDGIWELRLGELRAETIPTFQCWIQ